MNSKKQDACNRIDEYMRSHEFETVGEVIADIIHWCNANDVKFSDECVDAEMLVDEDLSFDVYTMLVRSKNS